MSFFLQAVSRSSFHKMSQVLHAPWFGMIKLTLYLYHCDNATFVFLLVENDILFKQFQHDKINVSKSPRFSLQSSFISKQSVFLHDLQAENLLILFARMLVSMSL